MASSSAAAGIRPRPRSVYALASLVALAAVALGLVLLRDGERKGEARGGDPAAAPHPQPGRDSGEPLRARAARAAGARETGAGAPEDGAPVGAGLFARALVKPEDERLLHEAVESAVAACMQERGFEYLPNPLTGEEQGEAGAAARLQPGDVEGARAHGYGLVEAVESSAAPAPDANAVLVEKLAPDAQRAWHEALLGPPIEPIGPADRPGLGTVSLPSGLMVQWNRDSCLARARRALYGDDVRHIELTMMIDELREEVEMRAHQEPAYRDGVDRWRACMSRRGFSAGEPGVVPDSLEQEARDPRLGSAQLREREAEAATADAVCFREAGLAALFDEARTRAEAEVERQQRSLMESLLAMQAEAVERARSSARR